MVIDAFWDVFFASVFFYANSITPFCEKEKNPIILILHHIEWYPICFAKRASKPSFTTRKVIFCILLEITQIARAYMVTELIFRKNPKKCNFRAVKRDYIIWSWNSLAWPGFAWFCVVRVGAAWFGAGNLPAYRAWVMMTVRLHKANSLKIKHINNEYIM